MTSRTRREAIQAEQRHLREEMLEKMGAELSEKELLILNDYILKGRCRIKKRDALMQVAVVLEKLDVANQKSGYFPKKAFSKFCAKYLVKRCLNAVVYGWIPSNKLLKQTQLPVSKVKEPVLLKIFNFFADLLSK